MHLIRRLVFIEAHHGFILHPTYINTRANHPADDLSHNVSVQGPAGQSYLGPTIQAPNGADTEQQGGLGLAYGAALKRFRKFCNAYNVTTPFPLSEHLLCCFKAFLADHKQESRTSPLCGAYKFR